MELQPDNRRQSHTVRDAHQRLEACGVDIAAILILLTTVQARDEVIVTLIQTFGALRQQELRSLIDASRATISRDVAKLHASGMLAEHTVQERATGRPTVWFTLLAHELPSDNERQFIVGVVYDLAIVIQERRALNCPVVIDIETEIDLLNSERQDDTHHNNPIDNTEYPADSVEVDSWHPLRLERLFEVEAPVLDDVKFTQSKRLRFHVIARAISNSVRTLEHKTP